MTDKIIDFHNHIFPDKIAPKVVNQLANYYHYEMHGTGEVDNLVRLAKEGGMYKLIVHSTATKVSQVETINTYLGETVKKQDGFFVGFGTLHPDFADIEGEIERIIALGLKGLKFHPDFQGFEIDCDKMFRIYEAVGNKLPILMHTGDETFDRSSPKRMARAVDAFPEVTFIAAHFGGYMNWEDSYEYLAGKDLYMDTSSALDKLSDEFAVQIIRKPGADKFLYASDYPIITHKECLKRFLELPLTEEEFDRILYWNAAGLLGIE